MLISKSEQRTVTLLISKQAQLTVNIENQNTRVCKSVNTKKSTTDCVTLLISKPEKNDCVTVLLSKPTQVIL